jgi:hypothetical protein
LLIPYTEVDMPYNFFFPPFSMYPSSHSSLSFKNHSNSLHSINILYNEVSKLHCTRNMTSTFNNYDNSMEIEAVSDEDMDFDTSSMTVSRPLYLSLDVDSSMAIKTADIYQSYVLKEDKFKIYNPHAKYLKWRRVLVDWMCDLGNEFELQFSTTHVAILYLDRILQVNQFSRQKLQLVAMCCCAVAAKFEEAEERVPSMADLVAYADNPNYTVYDLHEMERMILHKLDWNLSCHSTLHYLEYFLSKGSIYEADTIKGKFLPKKVPRYIKKYVLFFTEICLQDYAFQKYPTSLLASAMLACCRRSLYIKPLWRPELESLTGFTEEDILSCYEHVWSYYMESFPSEAVRRKSLGEDDYYQSPNSISNF